jgi:hypothetical protein
LWACAAALTPGSALAAASVLSDGTVRFQVGSSELTPESEQILDRLAGVLKQRPELDPIELVGHTDDQGAEATNRQLSVGRAEKVRQALVTRGIRPSRILVRGAGSAEPLSAAATPEARALNRRVEVWVTPQRPVAAVTRVHRKVQSREAAAPAWQAARVGQALRRQAKVRTEQASSSEVTFQSTDKVQLGPEALVVIYEDPGQTRRARTDVGDVEVEQGTIFAALAARPGQDRALEVGSRPSRVSVRSKRTRVDVRPAPKTADGPADRQVSTVSVFEGRSDVKAQGKAVAVAAGYGTRVREGQPPEPPAPLPPAPEWVTAGPLILGAGEGLALAWRRGPAAGVEVQMGLADDPEVKNPHRLWRVQGDATRGGQAEPGLYHLRLVGVDARDISGAPGRPLALVALPPARDAAGAPVPIRKGVARPRVPGPLRLPPPPGATFTATRTEGGALALDLWRAGPHRVPLVVTASTASVRGTLQVWVPTATLTADRVLTTAPGDAPTALLAFSVAVGGQPLDGLQFVAAPVGEPTPRLTTTPGAPQPLDDCRCQAPPGARRVEALGGGRYRVAVPLGLTASSTVTLRVFEPRLRAAAELRVQRPAAASLTRLPRPSRRGGSFLGVRVGALVSHEDAPTAELSLELGHRLLLAGGLELDLSVEGGWLPRTVDGARVHAFPLLGRVAVGLDLGAPRLYAGGGGGVRFLSPGTAGGVATGFAGVGYRFGHSEFLVEGAYRLMGRAEGSSEELAGWAVVVGYRVGTFDVSR